MAAKLVATNQATAEAFYEWAIRFCDPDDVLTGRVEKIYLAETALSEKAQSDRQADASDTSSSQTSSSQMSSSPKSDSSIGELKQRDCSAGFPLVRVQEIVQAASDIQVQRVVIQLDAAGDKASAGFDLFKQLVQSKKVWVLAADMGTIITAGTSSSGDSPPTEDPKSPDSLFDRVLVPVDSPQAWAAMDTAMNVIHQSGKICPLLIAKEEPNSQETADRQLSRLLLKWVVEDSRRIEPKAVVTSTPQQVLREQAKQSNLVLLGEDKLDSMRLLRKGNVEQNVLPVSPNTPLIVVFSPQTNPRFLFERTVGHLFRWIPNLTRDERTDLTQRLMDGATWNADFVVMMGLATAIASLGLLQNSTAVVIGAMLVAPLMTPLIAAGWAMTQGNVALFRQSMRTMGFGVLAGLALAFVLGLLVPRDEMTPEVFARASPDLIDLGVAAVSGVAAAYALSRSSVSAALPGVAISAALVPPLSCVGIGLSFKSWPVFSGAGTLLLANLAAIVLGSSLTFRVLGVKPVMRRSNPTAWTRRAVIVTSLILVLLLVPLWLQTITLNRQGQSQALLNPVSPRMRAALMEYIRSHEDWKPVLIGRLAASGRGHSEVTVGVILATDEPIGPQVQIRFDEIASEVLGRPTEVYLVPVSANWQLDDQADELPEIFSE